MTSLNKMLEEEPKKNRIEQAQDNVSKITEDVRAGRRKNNRATSLKVAQEMKAAIDYMFEDDPIQGANSIMQTYKDRFRDGVKIGFVVGALLAFVVAYFIS